MATASILTRRRFLKTTTESTAGLVIGFHLPAKLFLDSASEQEQKTPNPFNAWIRISPDNRVTLILAKSEMGQGVMTSLPMILADELNVNWKTIAVEQAATRPEVYSLGTGGSGSVASSYLPLRRAAAAAREMLIAAAARRWNVNTNTCVAKDGGVLHGARNNFLTYGELAEDAAKLPVPNLNKVALKNPDDFTLIGHATQRVEVKDKVTGAAKFGIDARQPGMLYAVIARCPVFGGQARSFDAAKAKKVPGVRDVIQIEPVAAGSFTAGGVAVLAGNSWAAMQGRKALQITWDEGPHASESSESLRDQCVANAAKPGKVVRNDGDVNAAMTGGAKKLDVVYELPFAPHATMEPMNCTVIVRDTNAEAWVPTQAPQWAQDIIAKTANLPADKVVVHTTLMGGGFGRRYQADFVMEAVQIAKAFHNTPVMVLWSREDDMQHDFYRPASYHRFSGALDAQGTVTAWKHFQTSTSIEAMWGKEAEAEKSEFATAAFIPYAIPNYRVEYTLAQSGVPRAWWRSVEHSSSGFVVETFVDELAAAAGADPYEFRLKLIGDDRKVPDFTDPKEGVPLNTARLKGVLKLAAEKGGWGNPLPKGVGRGIAAYYSFNTYTAAVAEVTVDGGSVRLQRLVYAVDCGRPVNPDGIRAQVEGAAVYGISACLKGAITIKNGRVEQSNFNDYEVPRIADAPRTEVHIVNSTEDPTGIGEPGLPVVTPAIFNAVYALTGKRIRRLPVRAEDLA